MTAAQLTAFESRVQTVDEALTPMEITVDAVTYEAAGTHAGEKHVRLLDGGEARNKELHFTLRKTLRAQIPLHHVVTFEGERYQIRKIWGIDSYDPVWSYRAEQWYE